MAEDIYIVIKEVTEEPSDEYCSYQIEEISHLIDMIKDGCTDNGTEYHLYNDRLYETEKIIVW